MSLSAGAYCRAPETITPSGESRPRHRSARRSCGLRALSFAWWAGTGPRPSWLMSPRTSRRVRCRTLIPNSIMSRVAQCPCQTRGPQPGPRVAPPRSARGRAPAHRAEWSGQYSRPSLGHPLRHPSRRADQEGEAGAEVLPPRGPHPFVLVVVNPSRDDLASRLEPADRTSGTRVGPVVAGFLASSVPSTKESSSGARVGSDLSSAVPSGAAPRIWSISANVRGAMRDAERPLSLTHGARALRVADAVSRPTALYASRSIADWSGSDGHSRPPL